MIVLHNYMWMAWYCVVPLFEMPWRFIFCHIALYLIQLVMTDGSLSIGCWIRVIFSTTVFVMLIAYQTRKHVIIIIDDTSCHYDGKTDMVIDQIFHYTRLIFCSGFKCFLFFSINFHLKSWFTKLYG